MSQELSHSLQKMLDAMLTKEQVKLIAKDCSAVKIRIKEDGRTVFASFDNIHRSLDFREAIAGEDEPRTTIRTIKGEPQIRYEVKIRESVLMDNPDIAQKYNPLNEAYAEYLKGKESKGEQS